MVKKRKLIEAVKDEWETLDKDKFSDKQKRFFFAVGAMRDDKKDDGKVQVNYSKIPKVVKESAYDIKPYKEVWGIYKYGKLIETEDTEEEAEDRVKELEEENKNSTFRYTFNYIDRHDTSFSASGTIKAESEKEVEKILKKRYKGFLIRNIDIKEVFNMRKVIEAFLVTKGRNKTLTSFEIGERYRSKVDIMYHYMVRYIQKFLNGKFSDKFIEKYKYNDRGVDSLVFPAGTIFTCVIPLNGNGPLTFSVDGEKVDFFDDSANVLVNGRLDVYSQQKLYSIFEKV